MNKTTKTISLKITYFGQLIYFNGFEAENYTLDGNPYTIENLFSAAFVDSQLKTPLMNHYYALAKSDKQVNFSEYSNDDYEKLVGDTQISAAKLATSHYSYVKDVFISERVKGFVKKERMKEVMNEFSSLNTLEVEITYNGNPLKLRRGSEEPIKAVYSLRMPYEIEWEELISDNMRFICDTFLYETENKLKFAMVSDCCQIAKIVNDHMTDPPKYDINGNLVMNAYERRFNKFMRVGSKTRNHLIREVKKNGTLGRADRNKIYNETK